MVFLVPVVRLDEVRVLIHVDQGAEVVTHVPGSDPGRACPGRVSPGVDGVEDRR